MVGIVFALPRERRKTTPPLACGGKGYSSSRVACRGQRGLLELRLTVLACVEMQTGERLAPIDEAPFDIVRVDEDFTAPALSSAELLQSLLLIESQVRELDLRAAEADTVRGQLIMSRLQTLLEGAIDSLLALQSHEDREASLDPFAAEGSDWFSQYTPILAPP